MLPGALGLARLCVGLVIFALPKRAGWLFAGEAGNSTAVTIFARGFAARDIAIGANLFNSFLRECSPRPWLVSAGIADLSDAIAVLLVWRHLPSRHLWLAFLASIIPAAIEGWVFRFKVGR
jgi:hypothetical protein